MTLTTNTDNTDKIQRSFATHTPMWQRFSTDVTNISSLSSNESNNVYQKQYSHVYAQRLASLKPYCIQAVPSNIPVVSRVLDLREGQVSSVIICGTLVKQSSGNDKDEPKFPNKTCKNGDTLYLEDESGRVTLETTRVDEFATGVIVAVQGTVQHGGVLLVDKFFLPKMPPPIHVEGEMKGTPHVLLISGLNCAAPGVCSLPREMLLQYLEGNFTNAEQAAQVCRVVIAGNSTNNTAEGIQELDAWIASVCSAGIPISIIPGKDDPSTANWPQRPLHSSLLKYGGSFVDKSLLSRTPNPMACGLGNKHVVGTDGLNVEDFYKHTSTQSELDALKFTQTCGHVCPTGPSSVPTVPLGEVDAMVLQETPALYFAGNCNSFATDVVKSNDDDDTKTRVVCIPKFSETGQVVLVNLENLNVQVLQFDDTVEEE